MRHERKTRVVLTLYSRNERLTFPIKFGEVVRSKAARPDLCYFGRHVNWHLPDGRRRNHRPNQPQSANDNDLAARTSVHDLAVLGNRFRRNPRLHNHLHNSNRIFVERGRRNQAGNLAPTYRLLNITFQKLGWVHYRV